MSRASTRTGNFLPATDDDVLNLVPEGPAFLFRSPAMRALCRVAAQVAGSDAPILVYGESGTGKELFSRLIHNLSNRREKPFVPVNCGVLRGELFADKFFGHEAGAYTGANRRQKGSFEAAEDGTLFLDEVGEIPQTNQVDFLRVLEQRTFKRLGGEKDLPFSARIVAATNRSLPEMVQTGLFRADLYYRLNVVPIALPPLRDRREDILPLAEHFLEYFRHRYHKHGLSPRPCARRALEEHQWPGNVRELKNLMERVVLLHPDGDDIMAKDLPLDMRCDPGSGAEQGEPECLSLEAAVREAETRAMRRALAAAGGSKTRAAELLEISPRTFRHKVSRHGLRF
ncbi:sigma-54 interaction domain-containing protein [Desulfolutivibrio sulfoxidireducens]|uniref:sigma-54 interaction domain-containing protein n=1 Tax=Desulfolutivibrio sulfoxidireducens TaxID=2773299 RepID=UPI00159EB214|nr:sigma-54 dependent transcriptional regulator [Desulfolutivibrio sulfoxidireducens]QLA16132.1 AAA family ATPase [Desulfolutivibrio sulfoxidireducens]QLA19971.1 AAA family ATPase [Desulfolutivibrio sulfoxidireducens]